MSLSVILTDLTIKIVGGPHVVSFKSVLARLAVAAISMIMLVSMTAGTAYAATATNTTKGQGPGDGSPTGTPTYTWTGTSFTIALTIDRGSDTNPGSNAQQFELQFNGNPDVCSLADATVTVTGAGQCVVLGRVFAGGDYDTGRTDEMEIIINKGNQLALTLATDGNNGASKKYGQFAALSVSGGTTAGAITYSVTSGDCSVDNTADTATVTTLAGSADDCVIRATMAGNDNYNDVYDEATITVGKANQDSLQVRTDGTDGTSAGYNTTVALTNDGGGSGTGAYSYSQVSGDCTVVENTATITGVATDCVVRVTREADDNYLVKTDDATITVGKAPQADLQALSDGTDGTIAVSPETVTLSAIGGSGTGLVTFEKVSGSCNVAGSTATITGNSANCVVEATRAGDTNYFVTTDRVTITVNKTTQTITALADGTDGTTAVTGEAVALSISGALGSGIVSYAKVSGDCNVVGTTANITGGVNNCIVTASIAADADYAGDDDTVTITVGPGVTLPTTSSSPKISRSGKFVTVKSAGTWNANGGSLTDATYQWYQCSGTHAAAAASGSLVVPGNCVSIGGATTSPWRISGVNLKHLRVLVTRSNEAGAAYAWSATIRR